MTLAPAQIGNGSMPLRIGNLINTEVHGGPYARIPDGMFGVKMAVEIKQTCNVDIPTVDYDVPAVSDLRSGVVKALMGMINGEEIYAGCWGGIGRTGLFLAALAKVQIEYRKAKHRPGRGEDPVLYVRKHFIPHAVETQQQKDYIENFDVSDIVNWLNVTQTAMGLGGLTPARKTDGQKIDEDVAEVVRRTQQAWIADADKIGDPSFSQYAEAWKGRRVEANLNAADEAYPDTDSGDPVSLQEQIHRLEEKFETLEFGITTANRRASIHARMIRRLRDFNERGLTKPTLSARIKVWLKSH